MSLAVVLGSFFTALAMFLSSTADVFLGLPVGHFRTFQMLVLAMANVCAMALIDFPSSLKFTIACCSPIDSSLVFMLVPLLNAVCTCKTYPAQSETERRHSVLFIV